MTGARIRSAIGTSAAWILAVAVVLMPLALVVTTGSMTPRQFASTGLGLPTPWTFENAVRLVGPLSGPVATTAGVALLVTAVQTTSSVLAAYVFARVPFRGRGLLFAATIAGYAIPPVVTFLPIYLAVARLGLAGTFLALVLPSVLASPFAVLLLRQWFVALPAELFDAAELDGAGHLATIRRVVLPLSRPAVAAAALAAGVSGWNAYLWPRLIAGVRLPQLQVAIAALQTEHQSNWTLVMAAATIGLLPPLIAAALLGRQLLVSVESGIGAGVS
jgi:multiple sugar transport system permease protein